MNFRKSRNRSRRSSKHFLQSTAKWRSHSKRNSRKTDTDDSESEERKSDDIKDWVEEFFGKKTQRLDKQDQDVDVHLSKKQTLILSTLVPNQILESDEFDGANPRRFVGVLLMADVSGYTALSERYGASGKGGTYRLTVTLNTYLGSLIELIYSHGGDIIKFAGDAFLALWKTDKRTYLSHTIHTVIACALIIQHYYGSYETDVKVNLKVKLAISAGNLMFSPIGRGIDMNYIIIGLPVFEAKLAESLCASGEVKLAPTAWGHCYSRNYDYIINENGHVTIKSILYDPHEKDVNKPFPGFGAMMRQIRKLPYGIEHIPDTLLENLNGELGKNEALSLRTTILTACERNIGSEIRKFMVRPVLTQIDAHQPLEYLTEMRQVSVLFITLKPIKCPFPQLITIVNNTYQITCEIVYKSMGCVNKIILFDKDVMILVIFGLRGFKHESEAQAALKCAFSIRKSVSALDGVLSVSIGVTTGQVYCGVVGHPLRREFTVIGSTVNKAARLMCCFQNKITCDEITLIKSKMSTNGFTLMERIELKGIKDAGKIYEYSEDLRVKEMYNIKVIPPLLNRLDEMDYFENWISDRRKSYREFDALLLIGESRIGKTKLLEWMSRHCKNQGFHVCQLNLTSIHSSTPYLALTQILNQILGLREPISGFVKEEKIVQLMKVYNEDLCYLNDIIKARFAYYEGIYSQDNTKRLEKAKNVFSKLLDSMNETYVIFLDDLQNLDSLSWEFISLFFTSSNVFSIFSVTRGKYSSGHEWLYSVFVNDNIRKTVLGPLTASWIPPLACQLLDVDAVPNDLCNALRTKCKGMPGLVESFILHLFSSGAVELKQIQDTELEDWKHLELQFPDPALLHPQTLNKNDQPILDELLEREESGVIGICIVHDKNELNTDINVQNTDALVMIQIDSLTPYQQLLLKIASVIGNIISRDLLESIMYENNYLTTAKAIKRLFSLRILSCANVKSRGYRCQAATSITSESLNLSTINLTCECGFDYDPEISEGLPKYSFCKVMKFRNKNVRKTCYELLPMNQKKEFHSRVINYFENNKQMCSNCGGTLAIAEPLFCDEADMSEDESVLDFNHFTSSDNTSQSDISDTSQGPNFVVRESLNLKDRKHRSVSQFISDSSSSKLFGANKVSGIIKNTLSHIPILKAEKSEANISDQRAGKRVTIPSVIFHKLVDAQDDNNNELFDMIRPVTEATTISDWHKLGVIDSLDDIDKDSVRSINICLDKNVSNTDFSKCSCAELNMEIYEQLIHHATRAELKNKAVEFLLHYSYLNYLSGNTENIYPSLEQAELICCDKNNQEHLTAFEKRRFLGRIYSLQTAANLIAGKLSTAKVDIERAFQYYGVNLTKMSDFFRIMTKLSYKRKKYKAHEEAMQADLVFMINIATLLFSSMGDETLSRATAYRALDMVKKVNCSVIVICDTLSNVIQVELDRGQPEAAVEVERIAKNLFANLPTPIEAEDLFALGKLYMTIFKVQLAKATLAPAIRTGLRVVVISRFLHADNVSLDIIPDLVYLLLSRRRIEEAVHVIRLLLTLDSHEYHNCETWYQALCLDLILDAGLQIESPQDISRFAEHSLDRGFSEGTGRRRLVIGLWTYWLRADYEKKAKRFEAEALSWTGYENDDGSMTSLISAMRLAEGMLECLARKVSDLRKVVDMMELRSIADRELLSFEKDIRATKTLYPRWLHMRARSHKLSGRRSVSVAMFNQAKEEARKIHNHMEESLAIAATGSPVLWRQNARTGLFLNWRSRLEHVQTSWHNMMYSITTSTRNTSN